jgi:hypothetical protein
MGPHVSVPRPRTNELLKSIEHYRVLPPTFERSARAARLPPALPPAADLPHLNHRHYSHTPLHTCESSATFSARPPAPRAPRAPTACCRRTQADLSGCTGTTFVSRYSVSRDSIAPAAWLVTHARRHKAQAPQLHLAKRSASERSNSASPTWQ